MNNMNDIDCSIDVIFGEEGLECVLVNGKRYRTYEEALAGIRAWLKECVEEAETG